MSKRFTKIICVIVAVIVAAGIWLLSGCGNFYKGTQLSGDIDGTVSSNGGFLVEKGDYIYFVNGIESYTATNTYGTPVKGSIMRISKQDFADRNYTDVDIVVPNVVYSGNSNAGIFIYGDYVYYSTPSTEKNSDGEVLYTKLDFKSTKLDGTETMKGYYLQLEDNTTEYRYVEVDGTVYLVYVATSETLFNETSSVTNLHSLNLTTGVDTILAYNVASVMFDSGDLTNSRIYYTMSVPGYAKDYSTGSTATTYNQVYTVRADAVTPNEYDFEGVDGWKTADDVDDGEAYNVYINCGDLVFDGIGKTDVTHTIFNYDYLDDNGDYIHNLLSYTYTLSAYTDNTLFYTRTTTDNSNAYLFMLSESDLSLTSDGKIGSEWNPIAKNADREVSVLADGSSASSYTYLFNDNGFYAVLASESGGGITINKTYTDENGAIKLNTEVGASQDAGYYYILGSGTATVLFIEGDYLYYSLSGGNGYTVYRIDYTGSWDKYDGMPVDEDVTDFTPVRILDLDAASGWYLPEIVEDQLVFAADFDDMANYSYIMVCDLRNESGSLMSNSEIDALNDKFEDVGDIISDYSDTDLYPTDRYANILGAIKFAYFTGDADYVKELAVLCNEAAKAEDEDADDVYSEETLKKYDEFINVSGDWSDYAEDSRQLNHSTVYANRRDYYYTLLGVMSEDDATAYFDSLKTSYLQAEPEEESWWEGLSSTARGWFIAGVTIGGVIILGVIALVVVLLIRRNGRKTPELRKKRIKVDTTDDKNIDVYATDDTTESDGK